MKLEIEKYIEPACHDLLYQLRSTGGEQLFANFNPAEIRIESIEE